MSEFYYKLHLEFKGSNYLGWQKQKDFHPTVQGDLEIALAKVFKQPVLTVGSGRTDTGVHSMNHTVKVTAPFDIEPESLVRALNSKLNKDIRVLDAKYCDKKFRPTNDAISRTYQYLFSNNSSSNAFQDEFIVNFSHKLDFGLMRQACELIEGLNDFADFQCVGTDTSTTKREVFKCSIRFHKMDFHGILPSHYVLEIEGQGFLKQMVRLIMGTLLNIGRKKVTLDQLKESLHSPTGNKLGIVVSPNGLYKASVKY